MRKTRKSCLVLVLSVLLLLGLAQTALADGNSNYSPSPYGYYTKAPVAYEVEKVYYAADFEGMDNLGNLASMYVTDDRIYIASASAILVTDYEFQVVHILSEYETEDGKSAVIKNPDGIFVTSDGRLYVCEPDSGHILVFDKDYELLHCYEKPAELELEVTYKPSQIVVDSLGRMYVIANNIYEGILELSPDNVYQRYFGTTTVSVSPIEIFYRAIASEAQLSRQSLLLPTEYSSMAIDSKGFIYTTIRSTEVNDPVRLLNVNGDDILPEDWAGDRPIGDIVFDIKTGCSSLSYIDCNEYGMYMVVDSTNNRIFTYDESSNMLFVFGGKGDKDGCFRNPVSARWLKDSDRVIVADRLSQSISVMKPTSYANAILEATRCEYNGERDAAFTYWQEALSMNANLVIARDAIGRSLYWSGDYEGSMKELEYIDRMDYYAKAFEKIREKAVRAYAPAVVIGVVVLIAAVIVIRRILKNRKEGRGHVAG